MAADVGLQNPELRGNPLPKGIVREPAPDFELANARAEERSAAAIWPAVYLIGSRGKLALAWSAYYAAPQLPEPR